MSAYLAAYDIADTGQRGRVARVLAEYGTRIQRSVFIVQVEPEELAPFRRRIGTLLARNDRFELIPIDTRPTRTRLSWQRPPEGMDNVILL